MYSNSKKIINLDTILRYDKVAIGITLGTAITKTVTTTVMQTLKYPLRLNTFRARLIAFVSRLLSLFSL